MILYHPKLKDLHRFCCPILIPREIRDQSLGLEIVATAVLLSVVGKRFLVTAKHVADISDSTHLLYPKSDTEAAIFSGERIRTNPKFEKMGPPASNFDLAVLHLGDAPIHPKYRFLGIGQLAPIVPYHLAVEHDREVITQDGQRVRPPKMKGMSGGAMWINAGDGFVLTAIISDHLTADRVVFGTQIVVAVNAVDEYLRNSAAKRTPR